MTACCGQRDSGVAEQVYIMRAKQVTVAVKVTVGRSLQVPEDSDLEASDSAGVGVTVAIRS